MRWLYSSLVLLLLHGPALADVQGIPRIIDGDTLHMGKEKIRLDGIDAPEMGQPCNFGGERQDCGNLSRDWLVKEIDGQSVTCKGDERDIYGRLLGTCFVGDKNLNAAIIRAGWAMAYVKYSKRYVAEEARAMDDHLGMWAGEFVPPWDWRKNERARCAIKGNISRSGERIYHLPGGQYYSRTKIDFKKGEKYFCSEDEARAAGWRKSKR